MADSSRQKLGDLDATIPALTLGEFALGECIGKGAMGEVWKAHHSDQNVKVALKVIVTDQAMDEQFRRAFRHEVRSVAMLNHPFVVNIIDYGIVDDIADDVSIGRFPAGSPYLIMEYAEFGALSDHIDGPVDWQTCRLILTSLLDALAHSHARGVIHRDIKPQNILLGCVDGRPAIKLTDYGLSYALLHTDTNPIWRQSVGTPHYMAPEQLSVRWRQYGPSTDLYGLGCVAFELLTGSAPFGGKNLIQIANAHINAPIPELGPDIDVPDGVEQWLQVLLAKDIDQRFRCSADAARALHQLCGPIEEELTTHVWQRFLGTQDSSAPDSQPASTKPMMPTHSLGPLLNDHCAAEWKAGHQVESTVPKDWRYEREFSATMRMIGTGRGLFGLRRLPVVGRSDEQDHLWTRFGQCAEQEKVGATVLMGPAGVGKDHLAEWLCCRAAELGVASVFRAYHEHSGELVDGIAHMLERKFSLTGLGRDDIESFFKSRLTKYGEQDEYAWKAMTELIYDRDDDYPIVNFASSTERYLAYASFLATLSQDKPILLWLNDAQWGIEAIQFVELLLEQSTIQAPIYVVITARDDILADRENHGRHMDTVMASPACDSIKLDPLDDSSLRELLNEALFLTPSATYEASQRSGGNPMHALEIIGHWLDRDWLHPTSRGFDLGDDAKLSAPDESLQVWSNTVDDLVDKIPGTRPILELGAILGEKFHRSTWEYGAALLDVELPEPLVETLLDRKYVYELPRGLVFAQNMLREALFQSARDHNRWQRLCHICAKTIDACSEDEESIDERVGFLLLEAGQSFDGAKRLLKAARHRRRRRDYLAMTYLCDRGQKALADDWRPEASRVRVQLLHILAHGWTSLRKIEVASTTAELACEISETLGDELLYACSQFYLLPPLLHLGEGEKLRTLAKKSLPILEQHEGYENECAMGHLTVANYHIRAGDYAEVLKRVEKARTVLGDHVDAPITRCNIDHVWLKARLHRQDSLTRQQFDVLLERCRQLNFALGEGAMLNCRAEVARQKGAYDEAARWYEEAIIIDKRLVPEHAVAPELNLALIAIETGDPVAGGVRAQRILQRLRRTTQPRMRLYAMAAMLPMHAARGAVAEFTDFVDEIETLVHQLSLSGDPDLMLCLDAACDQLQHCDEPQALQQKIDTLKALHSP